MRVSFSVELGFHGYCTGNRIDVKTARKVRIEKVSTK